MNIKNCPLHQANSSLLGLLTEPYKPFFFFGTLYNVVVMALWFIWLHGLQLKKVFLSFSISPLQAHAHWMLFGFPLFYIFGFLLTAFPKWVSAPQSKGPVNVFSSLLLFIIQILFLVGSLFSLPLLKLTLFFEFLLMGFLFKLLFKSYLQSPQKKLFDQSSLVLLSLGCGLCAQLLFQGSLWIGYSPYYSLSLYFAQFPYLLFLMMGVSYRILPFFTSNLPPQTEVKRGKNTLIFAFILITLLGLFQFITPLENLHFLKGVFFIALALLWLKELMSWNLKKSLSSFLLFSHYLAFFWAILFLLFKGLQELSPTSFQDSRIFLAIEHLFFIGAVSTLIWGISTRVTRGHGGLGFQLGKIDYFIFALLQMATCVRVLIPFLELKFNFLAGQSFHAAFLWWLAFLIWGIRYWKVLLVK